jgi:hypothetical protein
MDKWYYGEAPARLWCRSGGYRGMSGEGNGLAVRRLPVKAGR